MRATNVEAAVPKSGTFMNGLLKWAIIGGLVGTVGIGGVLTGLYLTGKLTPEKKDVVSKTGAHTGEKLSPEYANSAANSVKTVNNVAPSPGAISPPQTVSSGANTAAAVNNGAQIIHAAPPKTVNSGEIVNNRAQGGYLAPPQIINSAANSVSKVLTVNMQPQRMDPVAGVLGAAIIASSDLASDVADGVKDVVGNAKDALSDVADAAKDVVSNAGEAIKDALSNTGEVIKDAIENTGEAVKDVVEDAGDAVKDAVENTGEAVRDMVENTGEVITSLADDLPDVGDSIGDLGSIDFGGGFDDGLGNLRDAFEDLLDGIADIDIFGGLGDSDVVTMMMASLLGRPSPQHNSQNRVNLDRANPYNMMSIAQPPAAFVSGI